MTIEEAAYNVINDAAQAAVSDDDPLKGAEIHDTVYREIKKDFGVRVSDCTSDLAPTPGETAAKEFDGVLPIIIYSRVTGSNKSDRASARDRATKIALAVAQLFFVDGTMGGEVDYSRPVRIRRGYDNIDTKPYAVAHVTLLVNETGAPVNLDKGAML